MALPDLAHARRWFIYARISSDPGHDELGVQRQLRACRELADRLGGRIVDEFRDDDISAFSGKPRPAYLGMLERLEAGEADGILCWHPDRLHRSPKELESFIDLLERTGAVVATAVAGEYDLATPSGRMTARVAGAVARHESEHKSERIRMKIRELAEAGKYTHGWRTRPFGYRLVRSKTEEGRGSAELVVDAVEADVIRDLARRYLAGEGIMSLTRDLQGRVPTVTGSRWTSSTVKQMLVNPLIAGLRRARDSQALEKAPWPAIIEPEQHHELVARSRQNKQSGRRSTTRHLLSFIARCGNCGAPMEGVTIKGRRVYRCRVASGGCGGCSIGAQETEALVADAVIAVIDSPDFARRLDHLRGRPRGLEEERTRLQERLDTLSEMLGEGELDRQGYLRARARVQAQLDGLGEREAQDAAYTPLDRWRGRSLREAWDTLTLDQARGIVRAVLDRIVIEKRPRGMSPRFNPARVVIPADAWRV